MCAGTRFEFGSPHIVVLTILFIIQLKHVQLIHLKFNCALRYEKTFGLVVDVRVALQNCKGSIPGSIKMV